MMRTDSPTDSRVRYGSTIGSLTHSVVDTQLTTEHEIEVGGLDQLEEDVLDILTDVTGLGEGCGIHHGERHVQQFRQSLGQEGLAAPRGANHR